jgi:hypothetical protein
LISDWYAMNKNTLAQKMEPVLRRPGMYVPGSPVNLFWYLNGMFDLDLDDSDVSTRHLPHFYALMGERLGVAKGEFGAAPYEAMEVKLMQGKPDEITKLMCEVARDLLEMI